MSSPTTRNHPSQFTCCDWVLDSVYKKKKNPVSSAAEVREDFERADTTKSAKSAMQLHFNFCVVKGSWWTTRKSSTGTVEPPWSVVGGLLTWRRTWPSGTQAWRLKFKSCDESRFYRIQVLTGYLERIPGTLENRRAPNNVLKSHWLLVVIEAETYLWWNMSSLID